MAKPARKLGEYTASGYPRGSRVFRVEASKLVARRKEDIERLNKFLASFSSEAASRLKLPD